MDTKLLLEIFGYVGSALVVISMLMSSIVKLRIINTIGSVISGTYALLCGALPLVLMNACLIVINVVRLVKLLRTKNEYDIVDGDTDDSMVNYFVNRYDDDIKKFFPDFNKFEIHGKKAFTVCCEDAPAGVLIGDVKDGTLDIVIDYSTPAYRDCSVAQFLYGELAEYGVNTLSYSKKLTDEHAAFLTKMGYTKENDTYIRKV